MMPSARPGSSGSEIASRADLLDRALCVTLDPIPDADRRPEQDLWPEVAALAPRPWGVRYHVTNGAETASGALLVTQLPAGDDDRPLVRDDAATVRDGNQRRQRAKQREKLENALFHVCLPFSTSTSTQFLPHP